MKEIFTNSLHGDLEEQKTMEQVSFKINNEQIETIDTFIFA